mgnify:CR=1 FL=1
MYLPKAPDLRAAVMPLADGSRGVFQTIRVMRSLVTQFRVDPVIRGVAVTLINLVPEKDTLGEIRTLFEFVRDRVRYTRDVLDVETLSTPVKTLELAAGDCDDKSVLLATLLEAVGIPTRFVVTGYAQPGVYEHVYVLAMLSDGSFLPLDASEPQPPGWEPPGAVAYHAE